MTGMDEIEAAIGETDLVPPLARQSSSHSWARSAETIFFSADSSLPALQFGRDLVGRHRRGAHHRHRDAGGDVGKPRRRLQLASGGQRQRKRRHHRVARAGNIEHFAGMCRDMGDAPPRTISDMPAAPRVISAASSLGKACQQILRRCRHRRVAAAHPYRCDARFRPLGVMMVAPS